MPFISTYIPTYPWPLATEAASMSSQTHRNLYLNLYLVHFSLLFSPTSHCTFSIFCVELLSLPPGPPLPLPKLLLLSLHTNFSSTFHAKCLFYLTIFVQTYIILNCNFEKIHICWNSLVFIPLLSSTCGNFVKFFYILHMLWYFFHTFIVWLNNGYL